MMEAALNSDTIERRIYLIRGQRVMLDRDLAAMYGVSTGRLNEQVKRNKTRFPDDFMFQLNKEELQNWISHNAIPNPQIKMGLRISPHVFTEHGALMLASVLNSAIAAAASIQVVRAFVRLREMISTHRELGAKLAELEYKVSSHDAHIISLFDAIRDLMDPPEKPRKKIGFGPA